MYFTDYESYCKMHLALLKHIFSVQYSISFDEGKYQMAPTPKLVSDPPCQPGPIFLARNAFKICPMNSFTSFDFNWHLQGVFKASKMAPKGQKYISTKVKGLSSCIRVRNYKFIFLYFKPLIKVIKIDLFCWVAISLQFSICCEVLLSCFFLS